MYVYLSLSPSLRLKISHGVSLPLLSPDLLCVKPLPPSLSLSLSLSLSQPVSLRVLPEEHSFSI